MHRCLITTLRSLLLTDWASPMTQLMVPLPVIPPFLLLHWLHLSCSSKCESEGYTNQTVSWTTGSKLVQVMVGTNNRWHQLTAVASKEQELLGWDLFLKRITMNDWKMVQVNYERCFPVPKTNWSVNTWQSEIIWSIPKFSVQCWKGCNYVVHGESMEQHQLLRQKLEMEIQQIYHGPPTLAAHFPPAIDLPLTNWLSFSIRHLQTWVNQIKHSIKIAAYEQQRLIANYWVKQRWFKWWSNVPEPTIGLKNNWIIYWAKVLPLWWALLFMHINWCELISNGSIKSRFFLFFQLLGHVKLLYLVCIEQTQFFSS